MAKIDLDKAIEDPRHFFNTPEEVIAETSLGDQEKLAILESWERDARELAVAEEESMGGGEPSMLARIVRAANELRAEPASPSQAATKHGVATHSDARHATTVGDVMTELHEVVHVDMDVREAIARIRKLDIPLLPVVDGEEIVGVLTDADIHPERPDAEFSEKGGISDYLSTNLTFCYASDTLETAQKVMNESGHPRLLVIDEQDRLVGVVTQKALTSAESALPDDGSRKDWVERSAQGPGRDQGGKDGGPRNYSTRPIIRHDS